MSAQRPMIARTDFASLDARHRAVSNPRPSLSSILAATSGGDEGSGSSPAAPGISQAGVHGEVSELTVARCRHKNLLIARVSF